MSTRKDDIEALLENSQTELSHIEQEYQNCLEKQEISASLKIKIKNYCENLRSILDYIAHDIKEQYSSPLTEKDKIYFPISAKLAGFHNNTNKWYPNLNQTCPELFNYLQSIQSFSNADNQWLIWFNEVNNKNKHHKLMPQKEKLLASSYGNLDDTFAQHRELTEDGKVKITTMITSSNGEKVEEVSYIDEDISEVSKLTFQHTIPIFPTNNTQRQIDIIWTNLHFEGIPNITTIDLLHKSHQGIQQIYTDISKWLYQ